MIAEEFRWPYRLIFTARASPRYWHLLAKVPPPHVAPCRFARCFSFCMKAARGTFAFLGHFPSFHAAAASLLSLGFLPYYHHAYLSAVRVASAFTMFEGAAPAPTSARLYVAKKPFSPRLLLVRGRAMNTTVAQRIAIPPLRFHCRRARRDTISMIFYVITTRYHAAISLSKPRRLFACSHEHAVDIIMAPWR